MRVRIVSLVAASACGAACASTRRPTTQVAVFVASDLAAGQALTGLEIAVQTADGSATVGELAYPFPTAGRDNTWPVSFGVWRGAGDSQTLRLVITGYGQAGSRHLARVVERKVMVAFQDGKTLRLDVMLDSSCRDTACASRDETCLTAAERVAPSAGCGPIPAPQLVPVSPRDLPEQWSDDDVEPDPARLRGPAHAAQRRGS